MIAFVAEGQESFTVDELARRSGMTTRNVRAYQSRGLIPPPEVRGRTGYYTEEHLARLELVRDLQAEGFNLEAIKQILERAPGGSVGEVLAFTRAVAAPFSDERPTIVEGRELAQRWGDEITPELARKVQGLDLMRPLGEGRWELRSPRLERAAQELAELGVPLESAVELTAKMRRHAEAVARAYVDLFLKHVWREFDDEADPEAEWTRMREALDRLRPLGAESLIAMFGLVMTETVERALEREMDRMAREGRVSGSGRRRRAARKRG